MPRTTADKVKEIVKVRASHDLTPFIEAANHLVTVCCTRFDYTDANLELIERWLSAHFYCIQHSRHLMSMVGGLQKQVQSRVDLYLNLTHYGQMAKLLDYKLGLAALENEAKTVRQLRKKLIWLGKDKEYP